MQRKPTRAQLESDRRIEGLIDEVQTYSQPNNEIPKAPSGRVDPTVQAPGVDTAADGNGPNGRQPYEGFEPREHSWDRDLPWDESRGDLPVIDREFDIGDTSAFDGQVASNGADALAYYAPFHFYGRFYWGIYIRDYGLAYLASKFKVSVGQSSALTPSDSWILQAAWEFLLQHEYFHFLTEVASSQVELVSKHQTLYREYFFDPASGVLEEALANAQAYAEVLDFSAASSPRFGRFTRFLETWMKTQGPGYSDYGRWVDWRAAWRGKRNLTERMLDLLERSRSGSPNSLVSVDAVRPFNGARYSRVPVVRVADCGARWFSMARPFRKAWGIEVLLNTEDHTPHHIHVIFDDKDVVKLTWDELNPLKGESPLSGKRKKRLDQYLEKYRSDIDKKAKRVHPTQYIGGKK
jgi:hypothetical protein